MITCNDPGLAGVMVIIKRILLLIQIIAPILLIVMTSIKLTQMVTKPDDKKKTKTIINSFIAVMVIFLIPVLVNVLMLALGENTNISSCWNNASDVIKYSENYIETDDKKNNNVNIIDNSKSYEKGDTSTKLNNSNAVNIPNEVLGNAKNSSNLSILIVDDSGNVLAEKDPDVLREGGSTVKVFTGYAAVKLLDPEKDIVVSTQYAQNMKYMGTPDVKVGQKFSVSQAATKDFPGSSNITTANIAIAIGKKYNDCKDDEDAYFKGMNKINSFIREAGCTKTYLNSSSGVNYIYSENKWVGNKNGISVNKYGITANDLGLITILAMKDKNFSKGINYGKNGICPPPDSNSFMIKSGTQSYCHGVWGFNKNNKRYYIVILGVNCDKGDNKCTIFKDLYKWSINSLIK